MSAASDRRLEYVVEAVFNHPAAIAARKPGPALFTSIANSP
jgi:hypothetical protein